MLIKKNVVAISAQTRSLPQEFPNFIERTTPGAGDFTNSSLAQNGGNFLTKTFSTLT